MKSKIAIVTGATGLVGKAVVQKLIQNNIEVIALKNSGEDARIAFDLGTNFIHEKLDLTQVDFIIHCASLIPSAKNSPSECKLINEKINANLVESLKRYPSIHLVFISTTNFYEFNTAPITEESAVVPTNEYAEEKKNAEALFLQLENRVSILRINAPYHYNMVANTVLKIFVNKALNNENIEFYGTGSRTQDFTHVDEIANAVLCAMTNYNKKAIFNIASGVPISMLNLATAIKELIPGCTSQINAVNKEDPQENYRANFDITKAKEELNWVPKISILDGLAEWIKSK